MPDLDTQPSPFIAGLTCRCPRCGKGSLFAGYLAVAPACSVCGLDLSFAASGDGPAIFIIFIVSPIVIILAMILEAFVHPAPYVHLIIWLPVTIILCLALLRPFKALMIAFQYRSLVAGGRPS
jgi:uncharacterized protein (DUF983 family)